MTSINVRGFCSFDDHVGKGLPSFSVMKKLSNFSNLVDIFPSFFLSFFFSFFDIYCVLNSGESIFSKNGVS